MRTLMFATVAVVGLAGQAYAADSLTPPSVNPTTYMLAHPELPRKSSEERKADQERYAEEMQKWYALHAEEQREAFDARYGRAKSS